VVFRVDASLAVEANLKKGTLVSLAYDAGAGLLALVEDAGNKSGSAAKCLQDAGQKNTRVTIEMPRVDLLARVFPKVAPITGLRLFEKRGPGKIVFHAPDAKDEKGGAK
jgi:hypothetical protein